MSLTFPRDLPAGLRFASARFDLQHQQLTALAAGGQAQVANVGPELWHASYRTVKLREDEGEAMLAWLSSLRGGAKLFRAWNPLRRYTIARPEGYAGLVRAGTATAFTGAATVTTITALRDGVTLSGLPAAFVLAAGDWLSIPVSAARVSLHRIVEGATASGTGIASVLVEPAILPDAAVGVSADLAAPYMLAVLDAKSVQHSWERGRIVQVSFEAIQTLG